MSQKQVMPKREDLSRSLEINAIWTFDTEFPTIFNKSCTYITFKSAVKHRQSVNATPSPYDVSEEGMPDDIPTTDCLVTPTTCRTPHKPRKWVGPVTDTVRPEQYRGDHMLWGTKTFKQRLGLGKDDTIPRAVADVRNHFRVI